MGAASFKSLYLKRPHQSMPLRTVVFGALQIQHYDLSFATVLRVLTEMQAIVFVTCQSPRHLAGKDRCFQMTIRNVPMHANGTRAEF